MSQYQTGYDEAKKDISEYGLLYAQDAAEDFRSDAAMRDMFSLGYRCAVSVAIEEIFYHDE